MTEQEIKANFESLQYRVTQLEMHVSSLKVKKFEATQEELMHERAAQAQARADAYAEKVKG